MPRQPIKIVTASEDEDFAYLTLRIPKTDFTAKKKTEKLVQLKSLLKSDKK